MSAEMWDRGAQSEREMQGRREKEDSRVGGLTVDCNNRTHEGVLQSEAPFSAQRWYASGAVFMQLRKRGHPVVPVRMVEMQRTRSGRCDTYPVTVHVPVHE